MINENEWFKGMKKRVTLRDMYLDLKTTLKYNVWFKHYILDKVFITSNTYINRNALETSRKLLLKNVELTADIPCEYISKNDRYALYINYTIYLYLIELNKENSNKIERLIA
jgi:hypothetical protein